MSDAILISKTKEYENLPANVLGLDGWLLKAVPKEFRNQFLSGYEKVLRVALHPDRALVPEARAAREGYLKAVAEAVDYLQSGEVEYELATDTVPRRRNIIVQLRRSVEDHSQAMDRIEERRWEQEGELKKVTAQLQGMILESERNRKRTDKIQASVLEQGRAWRNAFNSHSSVMLDRLYWVRGVPIHFDRWQGKTKGQKKFLDRLSKWVRMSAEDPTPERRTDSDDNRLMRRHGVEPRVVEAAQALARTVAPSMTCPKWHKRLVTLKWTTAESKKRILGALPLAGLARFLRSAMDFPDELEPGRLLEQLKKANVPYYPGIIAPTQEDYTLPFLHPHDLAVLLDRDGKYQFVLVTETSADLGFKRNKTLADAWRGRYRELREQMGDRSRKWANKMRKQSLKRTASIARRKLQRQHIRESRMRLRSRFEKKIWKLKKTISNLRRCRDRMKAQLRKLHDC